MTIQDYDTKTLELIAEEVKKTLDFAPITKDQQCEIEKHYKEIWQELHSRYAQQLDQMTL